MRLIHFLPLALLVACSDEAENPIVSSGDERLEVMSFVEDFSFDPLPAGWTHRTFWTKPEMELSQTEKDGKRALRCETNGGGSILGRATDVPLSEYPTFVWDWYVEVPIDSQIDERTEEGDDHPARFYIRFRDTEGEDHTIEIIWSNDRFAPGEWKIIGDFHHYVANGLDANVGQWWHEEVDLQAIYRKATGRTDDARTTLVAIFCDSDETGTRSVAYFADVALSKHAPKPH